jgi:hypothetical protein
MKLKIDAKALLDGMKLGFDFINAFNEVFDKSPIQEQTDPNAPYYSDFEVVDDKQKQLPE